MSTIMILGREQFYRCIIALLLAFSATLIFSSSLFAQTEFLEKGESGYGLQAGIAKSGDAVGCEGAMGVSLRNRANLGFSAGWQGQAGVADLIFGPTVDLFLLRDRIDESPVSLGLSGSFILHNASAGHRSSTAWQHDFSAFALKRIPLGRTTLLVPVVGIGSTGLSDGMPVRYQYGGISLAGRKPGTRLILSFTYSHSEFSTGFGISFGAVFARGGSHGDSSDDFPFGN